MFQKPFLVDFKHITNVQYIDIYVKEPIDKLQ